MYTDCERIEHVLSTNSSANTRIKRITLEKLQKYCEENDLALVQVVSIAVEQYIESKAIVGSE
jgi:hypothetical protein